MPDTMLQAFLEAPRRLALRRVSVPEPGPGQVVVRVRAALTCGTDLKTFRRGHARLPVPGPFGHEGAGEVVAAGEGVAGWRPGDAVLWLPTAPCGRCEACRDGRENLCTRLFEPGRLALGTYAEYLLLPADVVRRHLFRLPDGVPFWVAPVIEPLACVLRGVARLAATPAPPGDVLVIGGGPIGLLFVRALRERGARTVTLVARRPAGAAVAERLGAAAVLAGGVEQRLDDLRRLRPGGFDAVVECTGRPEIWALAPGLVRPGGRVLLFGGLARGTQVAFDAFRIHYEEVDLIGSFHYTTADAREAYALLRRAAGDLALLITARRPLAGLPALFDELDRGLDAVKVAVLPDGEVRE